jgi:hypothetical protein
MPPAVLHNPLATPLSTPSATGAAGDNNALETILRINTAESNVID